MSDFTESTPHWTDQVSRIALGIRRRAFEHTVKHQGGYLSQACALAEVLATLYVKSLQIDESNSPFNPRPFPGHPRTQNEVRRTGIEYYGLSAPHLDRLFISSGKYALAIYSALVELGRLDGKALDVYRQDGSSLETWGGPHAPGFASYGGQSGSVIALASGCALARKLKGENGRVWVVCDVDELQGGIGWEILQILKQKPLNNLVLVINHHYYDENPAWAQSWYAACSPWKIHEIDGHDPELLHQTTQLYAQQGPLIIRANTHPCQGIVYMSLARLPLDYVRFKSSRDRMNFETAVRAELYKPMNKKGFLR